MINSKVVTMFTYTTPVEEVNVLPSMTVPDQSMSLREILERHARGLPIESGSIGQPIFHGEDFMPNIKTLDLSELQSLENQVRLEIAQARASIQAQKDLEQKQAEEAKLEQLVQERLKKQQADAPKIEDAR